MEIIEWIRQSRRDDLIIEHPMHIQIKRRRYDHAAKIEYDVITIYYVENGSAGN